MMVFHHPLLWLFWVRSAPNVEIPQIVSKPPKSWKIHQKSEIRNREFEVWSSGARAHGLPCPATTPPADRRRLETSGTTQ